MAAEEAQPTDPASDATEAPEDAAPGRWKSRVESWLTHPWKLTLLSGLLLMGSFPPFDLPIVLIAFVPWLLALPRFKRMRSAAAASFLSAMIFCGVALYWLAVMEGIGGGGAAIYGVWLVACAAVSIYYLGFGMLARWLMLRTTPVKWIVLLPFLWCGLEIWRYYFPAPGPLIFPGYALHHFDALIQIADLGSVHLVTFFVLLINVGIAVRFEGWLRGERKIKLWASGTIIAALALNIAYGAIRMYQVDSAIDPDRGPVVALIQPNISQKLKNSAGEHFNEIRYERHEEPSRAHQDADLIVWSETAFPWSIPADFEKTQDPYVCPVLPLARQLNTPIVFGALTQLDEDTIARYPWLTEQEKQRSDLNTAWVVDADGRVQGRHDKVHIVPGGEYIPLRGTPIGDLCAEFAISTMNYTPALVQGWRENTFTLTTKRGEEYDFSCNICYEFAFPQLYASLHDEGNVDFQLTLSNEAWYFDYWEHEQALVYSQFRAIESRTSVARCTNTGITCVIDPLGQVVATLGQDGKIKDFEGVLHGRVPVLKERMQPLFLSLGLSLWYIPGVLSLLLLLGAPIHAIFLRRRARKSEES